MTQGREMLTCKSSPQQRSLRSVLEGESLKFGMDWMLEGHELKKKTKKTENKQTKKKNRT